MLSKRETNHIEFIGGAPKMRLHFATDEDYFAAKDHLFRKVGNV